MAYLLFLYLSLLIGTFADTSDEPPLSRFKEDKGVCANITADINFCDAFLDGYDISYYREGDLMLGGLFPVHQGVACSVLEDMGTIQRLEAMAFAVGEVNKNPSRLKNLTLGFRIFDTCNSETATLARTLQLLPACAGCTHYPVCAPVCPVKVYGIVGPESSSNTLLAAHASNIAMSPVVSYFATSVELNSAFKFPTLFKTVPSDDYQVTAMLDLMAFFGWSYFSIVHSNDRYGRDAAEYMQSHLEEMCLAVVKQVSRAGTNSSYDDVVRELLDVKDYSKTSTVVLFTDGLCANKLFQAVERLGVVGEFMWIGSEGWGASLNDIASHVSVAKGALTFVPHTSADKEFEEYFQVAERFWIEDRMNKTNAFECNTQPLSGGITPKKAPSAILGQITTILGGNKYGNTIFIVPESSCYQYNHINADNGYVADSTVSLVTSAVYAFAQAMEGYLQETYPENVSITNKELSMPPWKLIPYLVEILGFADEEKLASVGAKSQEALYDINNLQEVSPGSFAYVVVGNWSSRTGLFIVEEVIQWPGEEQEQRPSAYCSESCGVGEAQVFYKTSCCWECEECGESSIVANKTKCQVCPERSWPNEDRSKCEEIPVTYLHWSDPAAIIFVVFASSNLILAKLSAIFFVKHKEDPLIKASGRELMAVIFFGIFLQNLLVFVLIAQPSEATCVLSRFVFGLDFTITYAPLLVKSNRIFRIFRAGKRSPVPPKWIKPREQVMITFLLISVQILITLVLVITIPTEAMIYLPRPDVVELTCSLEEITVLIPLMYNFVLVFACLAYSWKTRRLPTNFRESRYITFSVFTTLIIWSAFIPIYLTTSGSSSVQRVEILASVEIFSSFITLSALFFPKFYALSFVPRDAWHLDKEFLSTTKRFRLDSERQKSSRISPMVSPVTSISSRDKEQKADDEVFSKGRKSPDGAPDSDAIAKASISPIIQRRSASVDVTAMTHFGSGRRYHKLNSPGCAHCEETQANKRGMSLPSGNYPVLQMHRIGDRRRGSIPFAVDRPHRLYFVDFSGGHSCKEEHDNPNFVPSRRASSEEDSE